MEVKTYTTIFDRAKAAYGTGAYDDATLEFLFPELKVSEDERMLRAIIRGFENWKSYGNLTFNLTDVDDILAYLERQKEQKWGEEDEVYLKDALWCVEKAEKSCKDGEDKGACWSAKRWLKSLRPTHWKPSEKHLSALLAVFNDPDNIGSQTCQLALTDLYEQLKKLM